ncbi:hypothetical protein ACQKWADRAFT_283419 [Trichoderma austrokoningii]
MLPTTMDYHVIDTRQNNRERHASQTPVVLVRPLRWAYQQRPCVYWSDATNLASVSIKIRVTRTRTPRKLDTGHDRRRVICW